MRICFLVLSFIVLAFSAASGWGQATESDPVQNQDRVATAETAPESSENLTDTANAKNDEIREAFDALTQAEREFLELAKEKYGAETELTPENEIAVEPGVETEPKKALIPTDPQALKIMAENIGNKILGWLTSLPFLAQMGSVFVAVFLSPVIAGQIRKRVFLFRDAPDDTTKLRLIRDYIYRSGNFLRAILLVGLLALFSTVLAAIPTFGDNWLVKLAQSVAVVFLLYRVIKEFVTNDLFQKIAIWTVIPLALLIVFGFYDDLMALLNGTTIMKMGATPITVMTLIRLAIFGGIFFWLGNFSNAKGQTAIRSQENLDIATREVVAKLFQIILFVILFVLILSFAGIPLSGLVVIFSAVGLGIGFGLQPIAANFVSGLIILFDRSVRKGDFVLLPDGQTGVVDAINMRSTTVETYDGKDLMVPNTVFTENVYENWTHKDPRQRFEVEFLVAYDTDVDALEDILIPAVLKYEKILTEPEEPDLELREFGDFGIKFAIEFWADGVDDGPDKFTSDVNYIVWRTLKKHGIQMPLPQREIRMLK